MAKFARWVFIFFLVILASFATGVLTYFIGRPGKTIEYESLTEFSIYARSLNEFPASDNEDWEDPNYGSFNKSRLPSLFGQFRQWLGLWQYPPSSPKYLAKLLVEITTAHRAKGLDDGKNRFVHIKAHRPSNIMVFGDIHASFHSLLRDLNHLKEQGLLNDDLTLRESSTYILFNGDLIDRSPFSIDTLILVCSLMKKNPERIFYIAGNHERDGHWIDYGLRRELIDLGRSYSKQAVPFQKELMNFFATLPEAVYVSGHKDLTEVIRIAFNDSSHMSFDDSYLSTDFLEQKEDVGIHHFAPRDEGDARLDVVAGIKTEDWRLESRIEHGLGLLDQDSGATMWAVLSSPVTVNRIFLGFFDDAYATIFVDDRVQNASINLTHQDSRTASGFITNPALNIVTARDQKVATNANAIKLGSTMSLVRGVPDIGKRIKNGLDTLISEYNRSLGKLMSTIRLYVKNDDNIPSIARNNIQSQIDSGIRLFLLSSGATTTIAAMDAIEKSKSAIFFPATGADELRRNSFKHVIHLRASFTDEALTLARALRKEYNSTKIAIFYRDDAFGRPPFEAAMRELKKLGAVEVMGVPYSRGATSFVTQAAKIKEFMPDALGFFSHASQSKEILRLLGISDAVSTKLFALSVTGETSLRKFLTRKGFTMMFGSPVPNPKVSQLAIASEYRASMDRERNSYDPLSFEAYIAARLLLGTIEKLKFNNRTPQQILQALESIKHTDFEGLRLNFDAKTRSLSTQVWLEMNQNQYKDWIEYTLK